MQEFRNALGAFATGVTIVTTTDSAGAPVGVTASSFNSVSLDPPLVLWSLAKTAKSRDVFCESGHFAIHVLGETQEILSNRFARSGENKFTDVDWARGVAGSPILGHYAAVFQCITRHIYEGGDHHILVGEVQSFDVRDEQPLLFHGGKYAERRPRPPAQQADTINLQSGQFTDDFLFYLIARAYFQTSRPARYRLRELGLDQKQHAVLIMLSMHGTMSEVQLRSMLRHSEHGPDAETLPEMVDLGLLLLSGEAYDLSLVGRDKLVEVLAVSQGFEADIASKLTRGELAEIRRLLRRVVDISGTDVPIAWRPELLPVS